MIFRRNCSLRTLTLVTFRSTTTVYDLNVVLEYTWMFGLCGQLIESRSYDLNSTLCKILLDSTRGMSHSNYKLPT